jgi:hypothetical protein
MLKSIHDDNAILPPPSFRIALRAFKKARAGYPVRAFFCLKAVDFR